MRMSTTAAIGRIPVRDVHPVVEDGRRPAKAVTGETFEVSATVFREGHDAVAANVVLRDPQGLEEGAELYRRAAEGVPADSGRAVVLAAADTLHDDTLPVATRLAAALTPQVDAVLARHPLRDLVTTSDPLPLLV
uniref:maltotransferase domain-containing protein n=1 Tax=Streptomyces olivaceus TaxID=47716 RepID=UPI0004C51B65